MCAHIRKSNRGHSWLKSAARDKVLWQGAVPKALVVKVHYGRQSFPKRGRSLRPSQSKSAVHDKVLRQGAKYEAYPGQVRCTWQRPPLGGRHQDTMLNLPQLKYVLQWGAGSGDRVNFVNHHIHVKSCHHGVPGTWHNSRTYLSWYS